MGLFICSLIGYIFIGFVSACFINPYGREDACILMLFWPLLFIKWTLKQLFNILFKDWRD